MPAERDDASVRRSVVPPAAGRSLWLAAAWTGAGTALVAAVIAIAAVAVLWLPASGASGNAGSAIRAGVLTFLAALHGGITVDGLPSAFVPLGLTVVVGILAWRAGCGLADAADQLEEQERRRLAQAGVLQVLVFAVVCGVAAKLATLGSSSVSALAATLAGLILFAVTGGVAFVRNCALGEVVADLRPDWVRPAIRVAAIGLTVYVAAGALLVAGSLVMHHARVEAISHQIGGGWSGLPILVLGVLTAPNAAIAGASYLAGPGFAVGSGSAVSFGSSVHGTLPALPVLGAIPGGPANSAVWLLAAATPIVAGVLVAQAAYAASSWRLRFRDAGVGVATAVVGAFLLAWQGGGAIGSDRLAAVGASPWRFGLAVGAALAVVGAAALGALALLDWWRGRDADAPSVVRSTLTAVTSVVHRGEGEQGHDEAADRSEGRKAAG